MSTTTTTRPLELTPDARAVLEYCVTLTLSQEEQSLAALEAELAPYAQKPLIAAELDEARTRVGTMRNLLDVLQNASRVDVYV